MNGHTPLLKNVRIRAMANLLNTLRMSGFEILNRSHLGFFLFPGFWIVKKRCRKYLGASEDVQRELTGRSISRHRSSGLMHNIMRLESKLRKLVYYPFGIRCLVTCRRPVIS
jgi:hypothetical protein